MKKFVSMMLALVLTLSLTPSAFAVGDLFPGQSEPAGKVSASDKFTDVPADAWYLDELNYAVYNGYISGTSATTFSPDGTLTRGQFVTILSRTAGVSDSAAEAAKLGYTLVEKDLFADVNPGSYYYYGVKWAVERGVMNGVGNNMFNPDAPITVEQMGTAIANCIKMANGNGFELKNFKPSVAYADVSSISAWASESMVLMQQYGLLVTDAAGNVNPHKVVTRAECVVAVARFAKAVGAGDVFVPIQKSDTAEVAAKKIHDVLWAEGMLNSSMTQKEKAEVYFDWLDSNCLYDWSLSKPYIHDAYGALINGVAVCDGITYGYNMLLETEGIECSYIDFELDLHMWTAATLDGVPYHVDATVGIPFLTAENMWKVQNARQYWHATGDDSQLDAVYKELHLFWFADVEDEW